MVRYDKKIMDRLLDSYEESTLFDGKNKMTVHIAFPFNKKKIPAYFDESSLVYEEIHAAMQELEWRGLIDIIWRKGKEGHIISKVVLRTENLEEAYAYVARISRADRIRENRALLAKLRECFDTPVYQAFIEYLDGRLKNAQSVKEFIDLSNPEETEIFLTGIGEIERNDRNCYIREFSIEHFHDSKVFDSMRGKIVRVMRTFGEGYEEKDLNEILAEYGIYHTPNYVYFKGNVSIRVGECPFQVGELH